MEELIWINIISSTGERLWVAFRADTSILHLKSYLAHRCYANYTNHVIDLIYKEESMKDDDLTLRDYGVQSDHTIYVEGHNFLFDTTPYDTVTDMPDMSEISPVFTMMMQSLLSSSIYTKQIIGRNLELKRKVDSDPQLSAKMQNPKPQVFCQQGSPQMMQAPESQLERLRQNPIGHSIPSECTVAGPSTSFNAKGLQPQRSSDLKYEICGLGIILGIAALGISKRPK